MTSREKVIEAERQIRAIVNGSLDHLDCPFCGCISRPENELLCCQLMAELTEAVLDHLEFKAQCEVLERIADRAAKMQNQVVIQ